MLQLKDRGYARRSADLNIARSALAAAALSLAGLAAPALSASLIVDENGDLVGASGVILEEATYEVSFVSGTCAEAFSYCNEPDDFMFDTASKAQAASGALISQVFLDGPLGMFDSDPELTSGCGNPCWVFTPYWYRPSFIAYSAAYNAAPDSRYSDGSGITSMGRVDPTYGWQSPFLWARWSDPVSAAASVSEVPVPAGLPLLAAALAGLVGLGGRKIHTHRASRLSPRKSRS